MVKTFLKNYLTTNPNKFSSVLFTTHQPPFTNCDIALLTNDTNDILEP
jgi:hypothetical protein